MKRVIAGLMSAILLSLPVAAAPVTINHTIWDNILKANVDSDGFVDYAGIRVNKGGDLYEYLTILETADAKNLPEDDKLAFWINAYNAHMIKFILAHPKLEKIDEDLGMFDKTFKIARVSLSLNDIEHRILRLDPAKGGPITGLSVKELDPRIHFVLNCGAIDCPKLLNRAYGKGVREKLAAAAENFANNPKYLRLENGKLVISSLMQWYAADFEKIGGVSSYLTSLTNPKKRPDEAELDLWLQSDYPAKADFRYDWTLNHIKNKK